MHRAEHLPVDGHQFDDLLRILSHSRRSITATLLATAGSLIGITAVDAKKKKKKKKKKKCVPDSTVQICAGKCGTVQDNCNQIVDCGSCACRTRCGSCFYCQNQGSKAPETCVVDLERQGKGCGEPGQVCQADGACVCSPTSCPDCTICSPEGLCTPCSNCCDSSGVCQPGNTDSACGKSGLCNVCSGHNQCQDQSCNCEPNCAGKCSGADDDCGGLCTSNCDAEHYCDAGACKSCDVCKGDACNFSSVQAAINAATAGNTIHICPGTYFEDAADTTALKIPYPLRLIGAGSEENETFNTILRPAKTDQSVVLSQVGISGLHLENLRITGGNGGNGTGFVVSSDSSVTVENCTITENHGGIAGGLYVNRSQVSLSNTQITSNSGNKYGGVFITRGNLWVDAASRITGNSKIASGLGAGGVYAEDFGVVTLPSVNNVASNTPNNCTATTAAEFVGSGGVCLTT